MGVKAFVAAILAVSTFFGVSEVSAKDIQPPEAGSDCDRTTAAYGHSEGHGKYLRIAVQAYENRDETVTFNMSDKLWTKVKGSGLTLGGFTPYQPTEPVLKGGWMVVVPKSLSEVKGAVFVKQTDGSCRVLYEGVMDAGNVPAAFFAN